MSIASNSYFDLAQRSEWQGNHKLALEYYREAVKLEPKRGDIWWRMSLTMINLSMFKEAKQAQETAAQLDPKIRETSELNKKLADIKDLRKKGPESLAMLLAYTNDKDRIIRDDAKKAIEDEHYRVDKSSVAPLVEALKSVKFSFEASYYLKPLVRIGAASVEPLLQLLSHSDKSLVSHVIEALGDLGDRRAIEPIRPFTQDEKEELRKAATDALKKLEAGKT